MATTDATRVRNVGLFGHGGTGKTTLAEHFLYAAGATKRLGTVSEGNTVGDYLDEEKERHQTITMKLMHLDWHDTRVHVVDHPGYADFLGEVAASAPLLDGAIIVVDATTGPQVGTDNALKYVNKFTIPHALFLNKLDRDNVDFDAVVLQIQELYGPHHVPLVIPNGIGAALSEVINVYTSDNPAAEAYRTQLMETVAEAHDELIEAYLENGTLSDEEFARGIHDGIRDGKVVPIVAGCVENDLGIRELMSIVTDYFPTPLEHHFMAQNGKEELAELTPDPNGPFIGQVFRSVVDPYVGHVTLFRVISGTLHSDCEFYNLTTGQKERAGKIQLLCGKEHETVDEVVPGDIAAMTKLKHTHFGDTIASDPSLAVTLPPIELPNSMVKLAIEPKSRADEDKIGEALNHIAEEDPTFKHYRDPDTHEHVIKGMGDLQLDILLNRMRAKYHIEAETHLPKVAYKETIRGMSDAQGKHKKQTGGHGQYGDVHVRFSPNERGAGYEFIDSVVGGVVPRQFIPHVDKGIQDALEKGVIAGFPVVDVKAELHFGSYHDVDSSEMAFKIAASMAVQKGIRDAKPCILEPVLLLEILIPEEYLGDITGDLNSRRGRILGMESAGPGRQQIKAYIPESEALRYATDLRSMTHGRGAYSYEFSHFDEVPDAIAKQLCAGYEKARGEGNG